ncbi:MAG: glutamate synthase-related protein [bacterium]|nr:glutamate synthase-related protein [bacterium]
MNRRLAIDAHFARGVLQITLARYMPVFHAAINRVDAILSDETPANRWAFLDLPEDVLTAYVLATHCTELEALINCKDDITPQKMRHLYRLPDKDLARLLNVPPDSPEWQLTRDVLSRIGIGAMSLGSKSLPSHTLSAQISNLLGMRESNAGEGGEDRARWQGIHELRRMDSESQFGRVHQTIGEGAAVTIMGGVFSHLVNMLGHHFEGQNSGGQNGISLDYLLSLSVISNKYGQGAKGGEGGLLGAAKNTGPAFWAKIGEVDVLISQGNDRRVYFTYNNQGTPTIIARTMEQLGITHIDELNSKTVILQGEDIALSDADGAQAIEITRKILSIADVRKFLSANFPTASPAVLTDVYSVECMYFKNLIEEWLGLVSEDKLTVSNNLEFATSASAAATAKVITITGTEGGTGAAKKSSLDHSCGATQHGVIRAYTQLLREGVDTPICAEGGVMTPDDIAIMLALGASMVGVGKLDMFGQGCIAAELCHEGTCPKSIAGNEINADKLFDGTRSKSGFMYLAYALSVAKKITA